MKDETPYGDDFTEKAREERKQKVRQTLLEQTAPGKMSHNSSTRSLIERISAKNKGMVKLPERLLRNKLRLGPIGGHLSD